MQVTCKALLFLFCLILPCALFASANDSAKQDTIVLADSLIRDVSISCPVRSSPIADLPYCINSQEEFNDFFNNACSPSPDIDFDKETLLWFPTKGNGGCEFLKSIKTIGNKVIYNICIVQKLTLQALC